MTYEIIHPTQYTPEIIARKNENGVFCFIPTDPENSDYAAYLEWLAEGNTAKEWTPHYEPPSPS
jgi:hypothetical protein